MEPSLVRGPELARRRPRDQKRCDGARRVGPARRYPRPMSSTGAAEDPTVRPSRDVCSPRAASARHYHDLRVARIDGHAAQITHLEPVARGRPRQTAVMTLVVAVARGNPEDVRSVSMDR